MNSGEGCVLYLGRRLKIIGHAVEQWRRTNLKVWGHRSGAKLEGHRSGAKRREKFFFGRVPPLFGSKSTISRFGERFRDGQYTV